MTEEQKTRLSEIFLMRVNMIIEDESLDVITKANEITRHATALTQVSISMSLHQLQVGASK
jgi:hypothetical protein